MRYEDEPPEVDVCRPEFWAFFLRMLRVTPNARMGTPCMVWTGLCGAGGHGVILLPQGEMRAHRYAYAMVYGDPGDLWVLHRCHNAACCNILHLYKGTPQQNSQDRFDQGSLKSTLDKARAPFRKGYIYNRYRECQLRNDIWTRPIESIDMDQRRTMDRDMTSTNQKESQDESMTQ